MAIIESLQNAIESGRVPSVEEIGGIEAVRSSIDSLARSPFLDIISVIARQSTASDRVEFAKVLVLGIKLSTYPEQFRAALEEILSDAEIYESVGKELPMLLAERVESRNRTNTPLVSAYALEALLKLALSGRINKHRYLALLIETNDTESPLFAEHAVTLAGAAFHVWNEPDLLRVLENLSRIPEASDGAWFELGLAWLRNGLSSSDASGVLKCLDTARGYFSRSNEAGEQRDDALAYLSVVDAVRQFASGESAAVIGKTTSELERALQRRAMWVDVAGVPEWMRPRFDREAQWGLLVRQIQLVASKLNRSSWLNASSVMEHVLAVYDADRTISSGPGLQHLVRPRIEDAFVRERGLFAHLDDVLSENVLPDISADVAQELRKRIAAQFEEHKPPGKAHEGSPYPWLRAILGDEFLESLPPKTAEQLEGVVRNHKLSFDLTADSVSQRIFKSIQEKLASNTDYCPPAKGEFDFLILQIIAFCRDRLDASSKERGKRGAYLYEPDAKEGDLQSDLRDFLQGNCLWAEVRTEVEGIGAGRADIYVAITPRRYVIELKRELIDSKKEAIEKYLAQTISYQVTNLRIGFLGVLDLSLGSGPPPHLEENFWVATFVSKGSDALRHAVVFRVPGNLPRPSSFSKASSTIATKKSQKPSAPKKAPAPQKT